MCLIHFFTSQKKRKEKISTKTAPKSIVHPASAKTNEKEREYEEEKKVNKERKSKTEKNDEFKFSLSK